MDPFLLVLISAWNDSGGAFLHRLWDGHPECHVYPFELQLGTGRDPDRLADWFRPKYRWPRFPADLADAEPARLFDLFLDEEVKGRLRDRAASRFRDFALALDEAAWRARMAALLWEEEGPRTPERVIAAYVRGLFAAWEDRRESGRERLWVGHCPVIVVDADRVLADCPAARIVHVVRDPASGFADMRRRVGDLDVIGYCRKWSLVNTLGFYWAAKYPARVRAVHLDALVADRRAALTSLCDWLGVDYDAALETPSWNGTPLPAMGPFGGVPVVSAEHERAAAESLTADERALVAAETRGARRLLASG